MGKVLRDSILPVVVCSLSFVNLSGILNGDSFGKECCLIIMACIMVCVYFLHCQKNEEIRFRVTGSDIPYSCLLLYGFCRVSSADNGTFIFFSLITIARLLSKEESEDIRIYIFIFFGIIHAYWGLKEYPYVAPIHGQFNNSSMYCNYLIPFFAVSLGSLLLENRIPKIISFISTIALLVAITLTQSRTGIVSLMAVMIYLFAVKFQWSSILLRNFETRTKRIVLVGSMVIIMAIVLFCLVQVRIDSVRGRLLIYKVSINMIYDKPVFGHGINSFHVKYLDHQADYFKENPNDDWSIYADNTVNAFNEFIQITAETGIIGLLIILVCLYYLFAVTSPNPKLQIWKAALFGIVISCFFSYPLRDISNASTLAIVAGSLLSHDKKVLFSFSIGRTYKLLLVGFLFTFSSYMFYNLYRQYQGYLIWTTARYNGNLSAEEMVSYYERAYPMLRFNGVFLYNYGLALSEMGNPVDSNVVFCESLKYHSTMESRVLMGNNYQKLKQYKSAEQCFMLAHDMVPVRFYPLYKLALLYEETKNTREFIKIAEEILKKPVKIESYAVTAIKKEIKEKLLTINSQILE